MNSSINECLKKGFSNDKSKTSLRSDSGRDSRPVQANARRECTQNGNERGKQETQGKQTTLKQKTAVTSDSSLPD
jgi:hypothetical protein